MIAQEEVYKIGKIGKPHGVHGEMQFHFNDDVFDTADADYLVLDVDGILVPFFMEEYRFRSDEMALIKLCDIDTEQKARQLTGAVVYFPRKIAEERSDNLSWAQVVGFSLIDNATMNVVGTIIGVDESTINILFEVETASGEVLLVPANEDLIRDVDAVKQTITIAVPDGLLDL